jgi:hypothetical protein
MIPVGVVKPVPEVVAVCLHLVISIWETGGQVVVGAPAVAGRVKAVGIVVRKIVVAVMIALTHAAATIPRGVSPTVCGRVILYVTSTVRFVSINEISRLPPLAFV